MTNTFGISRQEFATAGHILAQRSQTRLSSSGRTERGTWTWVSVGLGVKAEVGYLSKEIVCPSSPVSDHSLDPAPLPTSDPHEDDDPASLPVQPSSTTTLTIHIAYSPTYSCPYLLFQAHDAAGQVLTLEEIENCFPLFNVPTPTAETLGTPSISLQDHPILNIPFWTLHPCQTAAWTSEVVQSLGESDREVEGGKAFWMLRTWLGRVDREVWGSWGLIGREMFF
ncbi:hypothetical protein DFS34DRAFT_193576 [Phlyctochytrium arcticum]|nr:hypothetical protein DFS34DRAFT_193576 [Phlyctochytrium arcticum]